MQISPRLYGNKPKYGGGNYEACWSVTVIDKLSIRPKMTALLLMDFQRMVVDSYAVDKEALLGRVKRLAVTARNSGAMVIHVVVGFQLGYPEVSGQNSVFSSLKAAGLLTTGDPAAEVCPELTPQPGDVVVTKQRVSAFTGTNLDVILRSYAKKASFASAGNNRPL
jgi:nicotinamidase-related amidase